MTLGFAFGRTAEVHIEIGPEALTLQALKAARTAVEEHTEFVRESVATRRTYGHGASTKILAENALRGALQLFEDTQMTTTCSFRNAQTEEQHKDDDNDGVDDDVEESFEHTGPVDAAAQSMTREVKLIECALAPRDSLCQDVGHQVPTRAW